MDKLKKCPFCGGEAVAHVDNGVCVICRKCGARSKCLVDGYAQGKPSGSAINSVIKAWNNRQPVQQIIEKLEEELNFADAEKKRCAQENLLQFDSAKGCAQGLYNALNIIKELA